MPDLHRSSVVAATHFLNMLFMMLLARCGLEVLSAFPKLYSQMTARRAASGAVQQEVFSADSRKPWSSLDEEESWSPVIALPGPQEPRAGTALALHDDPVLDPDRPRSTSRCFRHRLLALPDPDPWSIVPDPSRPPARTCTSSSRPSPGHPFEPSQQLAYFVVDLPAGAAADRHRRGDVPVGTGPLPLVPQAVRGQAGRAHPAFPGHVRLRAFIVVHVVHGDHPRPAEGVRRIVLGNPDGNRTLALGAGLAGSRAIAVFHVAVTWFSLRHRRRIQRLLGFMVDPFERVLSRLFTSRERFTRKDISPYHRVNGYPPADEEYQQMARQAFATTGWRSAAWSKPRVASLDELRALGEQRQITKHNCIQGWTHRGMGRRAAGYADRPRCGRPRSQPCRVLCDGRQGVTENEGRFGLLLRQHPLASGHQPADHSRVAHERRPLPVEHGAPVRFGSRPSSVSRWSSGSPESSSWPTTKTLAWARAAGARTSSTTPTLPESRNRNRCSS